MPSALERLAAALGPGRVSTDPALLARFAEDVTECPPGRPEALVSAAGVEEVAAVVRACAETGLPLVPVVNNTNVGGLAIPERGGVILDLRPMNRIVEVNEAERTAVLEPGVGWGQLKEKLDRDHPALAFAYPLAPPEASVVCNCLMDGLTTLSLRHGPTSMWINGVEAVLGDGTVVRTGSAAAGAGWWGGAPMPDLTGLFVNMHGTTGIVTKLAVRLFPRKKHRRRFVHMAPGVGPALEWIGRLVRDDLCDDIGILTWPVPKMALGAARPLKRAAGDPALVALLDISSNHADELAARERAVREGGADLVDVERVARLVPPLAPLLNLPARLGFLLDHPGGGLTWIGTYGPMSRWREGIERGSELMLRHGWPPAGVLRPMLGGHFGVLRFLATFDRRDPGERARVRRMNEELVDLVSELGYIPYKTPPWVVARLRPRLDPGFLSLLERVRRTMDPAGILNPGKWA